MNKKEELELNKNLLEIYKGILYNNPLKDDDQIVEINYTLECKEFTYLVKKYHLNDIAGKGNEFLKAKRIMHAFAPRLTHSSYYDNHVECNAIKLLAYSLDNKHHGINCLNKSKIITECCLAVGIYARRVCIMPYSPYDLDNHVVVEIYDNKLNKWIMLDPTYDGFFIDENKTPLSLLEIRDNFANDKFVTFVTTTTRLVDLDAIFEKNIAINQYICKNLAYFIIETKQQFGVVEEGFTVGNSNLSTRSINIMNAKYRIKNIPSEYNNFIESAKKRLDNLIASPEEIIFSLKSMEVKPK